MSKNKKKKQKKKLRLKAISAYERFRRDVQEQFGYIMPRYIATFYPFIASTNAKADAFIEEFKVLLTKHNVMGFEKKEKKCPKLKAR